jgi:clan AA aspartic protease (TIGR02281 family)
MKLSNINFMFLTGGLFLGLFFISLAYADESDIVKADRQALAEAKASGMSSKIIAAKEQLSDDLGMEADQRRRDVEGITIPLVPDGQGHFLADVLINNKVHASLVVDTGSPVIMLTSAFIQKLDLDTSQSAVGYVELLSGKYKAAAISLDNVMVGDAHAQDVSATVLLESNKEIKDGLLGMSFLSKFHFTLDQKGQKLVLRKSE